MEWYWCADCEDVDCFCGGGFYGSEDDDQFDVECECCGSMNVNP